MQTFAPNLIFSAGPQIIQTEASHFCIIFPVISFPFFPIFTFPASTQVPFGDLFFLNKWYCYMVYKKITRGSITI